MNWNPWRHIRIIGGILCIIAAFCRELNLSFLGLMLIAVGIVGAVDRLERLLEDKDKNNDETQA